MATSTITLGSARSRTFRRELDLIRITALRTLKVRYRGTALGILWSFANPILMTMLYTAIFGTVFASYYGSPARYILSAFIGVTVVTFFQQATGEALTSVVGNGALLNKIAVPREVFPLASVCANAFQQCWTTFPLVFLMTIVLTRDPVRIALVPVLLACVLALTVGFSLALSALFVFFRDLPHLWSLFGFVIWLSSPIFYPVQLVSPAVRNWLLVNPVGQTMISLREVVLGHGPIAWASIGQTILVSAAVLVVGIAIFRTLREDFMDLL